MFAFGRSTRCNAPSSGTGTSLPQIKSLLPDYTIPMAPLSVVTSVRQYKVYLNKHQYTECLPSLFHLYLCLFWQISPTLPLEQLAWRFP